MKTTSLLPFVLVLVGAVLPANSTLLLDLNTTVSQSLNSEIIFLENVGFVNILADSGQSIVDSESTLLNQARITITSRPDGLSETLRLDPTVPRPVGTVVNDGLRGELILEEVADFEMWLSTLRSIQYVNTEQNPSITVPRQVRIVIRNVRGILSEPAYVNITVEPFNNPPRVFLSARNELAIRDTPTLLISSSTIRIEDPDSELFDVMNIIITNPQDGSRNELIEFSGNLPPFSTSMGPTMVLGTQQILYTVTFREGGDAERIIEAISQIRYNNRANIIDITVLPPRQVCVELRDYESFSPFACVNISISPPNDFSPMFMMNTTSFNVTETGKSITIATVIAADADTGSQGMVVYSIDVVLSKIRAQAMVTTNIFSINSTTGEITAPNGLDADQFTSHVINVLASDQGNPVRQSSIAITVLVEFFTNSPPVITIPSPMVTLPYGETAIFIAPTARITDPDNQQLQNMTVELKGTLDNSALQNHNQTARVLIFKQGTTVQFTSTLRSIMYSSMVTEPSLTSRAINIQVCDPYVCTNSTVTIVKGRIEGRSLPIEVIVAVVVILFIVLLCIIVILLIVTKMHTKNASKGKAHDIVLHLYAEIDENSMYSPMNQSQGNETIDGYHTIRDHPSAQGRAYVRPDSLSSPIRVPGSNANDGTITSTECITSDIISRSNHVQGKDASHNLTPDGGYSKVIDHSNTNDDVGDRNPDGGYSRPGDLTPDGVYSRPVISHSSLAQGNGTNCSAHTAQENNQNASDLNPDGGYTRPELSSSNLAPGTNTNNGYKNQPTTQTRSDTDNGYVRPDVSTSNLVQGVKTNHGYQNVNNQPTARDTNTDDGYVRPESTSSLAQGNKMKHSYVNVRDQPSAQGNNTDSGYDKLNRTSSNTKYKGGNDSNNQYARLGVSSSNLVQGSDKTHGYVNVRDQPAAQSLSADCNPAQDQAQENKNYTNSYKSISDQPAAT